jgi:hypothetical protein
MMAITALQMKGYCKILPWPLQQVTEGEKPTQQRLGVRFMPVLLVHQKSAVFEFLLNPL